MGRSDLSILVKKKRLIDKYRLQLPLKNRLRDRLGALNSDFHAFSLLLIDMARRFHFDLLFELRAFLQ